MSDAEISKSERDQLTVSNFSCICSSSRQWKWHFNLKTCNTRPLFVSSSMHVCMCEWEWVCVRVCVWAYERNSQPSLRTIPWTLAALNEVNCSRFWWIDGRKQSVVLVSYWISASNSNESFYFLSGVRECSIIRECQLFHLYRGMEYSVTLTNTMFAVQPSS